MFYLPSRSPEDWRGCLADPQKQWKKGYSARALAYCWESSDGFPKEVLAVLNAPESTLAGIEPLIALPEHKVKLPGGSAASQSDIWILARYRDGLVSMAVEGKVEESFGETLSEWKPDSTPGRRDRLEFLKGTLGIGTVPEGIRYQLLHRTASAVVEAQRFLAVHAVLIVHSFSTTDRSLDDYQAFADLFGLALGVNQIGSKHLDSGIELHLAWIRADRKHLEA